MQHKYLPLPKTTKVKGDGRFGRFVDPSTWKTGPDPAVREKYYAYLKHRAQCNYRSEPYNLTWEDWQSLWTDELFLRRGRSRESLIMQRIRLTDPWQPDNVVITTRGEHIKRTSEYRNHE